MTQLECAAILFDLDGVLIDSTAVITRHWQEWAQTHGLDLAAIMQVSHGRPTLETMRVVAPHLPVEDEARRFAAGEVLDTEGILTIEGASALLNSLPVDSWAIVTSCSRDLAAARLASRGLPVPHVLVTADDVVNGKPHPEPYLAGVRRLGLPPSQCVVVEDAPAGLAAAAAAGMRTIAIAATHLRHELGMATVIADQLRDIKVTAGTGGRLIITVRP